MALSQCLRYTIWLLCIIFITQQTDAGFLGSRPKRQFGANMYLPDASFIPGGAGDDEDWSAWSSPSECSRSCGGGVSFQTRECLRISENETPSCQGGNTRYFSCNTQDCPDEEADFRSQQCARYNSVPFDGVYYDWVPYTNAPNPCELNCMPKGERFYYRQKAKVIDGTRCNDRDLDVCVDGQCQSVGCDMMLGSEAKEDKCRKCGGDGVTCKTISDTYKSSNLEAGYNDILLIPSGATNIKIEETEPSNNYLACRNLSSHYYLNGNWRIDFPRPIFYAGCWWNYQRKPNGFAAPDQLYCGGPTTESLYIVMLVQDKSVSVRYEYSIPSSISQNTPDAYTWTHMEFSPCTAECGGGTQSRNISCNNRITLEEVNFNLCESNTKPAETQECGQVPCAPHWVEDDWGKCSKGCGADGMQNRTVTCVRTSSTGQEKTEEDSVCLQLVGNKPATTQECNRDVKNCPKYHLGPWTPCDKLCGEGKQKRKVTCFIEENGHKKVLPESECIEEKPETEKTCTLAPCEGVDWIISEWSGCKSCGQNKETRTAICGSKAGKVYADEFCEPEVPLLSRLCKSNKCDSQWFSSEWSKCSAACGKGVQSRIVLCGVFNGKTVTPAEDDAKCNADNKPESEQACEGEEKECPGQWFTGPWGPCSNTCGGGERVREVLCLVNGTKSMNCDESKVEALSEKCNVQACTDDEVIPVDSTSKPLPEEKATSGELDEDDECDEEESEEDKVNLDDEFELIEPKQNLKLLNGVHLDGKSTKAATLFEDDLMLSDSPATDESTVQETSTGASESTVDDFTDDLTDLTDGSGDELDTTTFAPTESSSETTSETSSSLASSELTETTGVESSTEVSASSDVLSTTVISTEMFETTEKSSTAISSTESSTAFSSTESSSTSSTIEVSSTDSTSKNVSTTDSSTKDSSTTDSSTTGSSTAESSALYSSTVESSTTESSTVESSKRNSASTETSTTESSTTLSSTSEPSTTGSNTTESSTTHSTSTETYTTDSSISLTSTTEYSTSESSTTGSPTTESSTTYSTKPSPTDSSRTESSTTDSTSKETSKIDSSTTESSTTEVSTAEISQVDTTTVESSTVEYSTTDSTSTETSTTGSPTTESSTTDSTSTETSTTETSTTGSPTTESSTTYSTETSPTDSSTTGSPTTESSTTDSTSPKTSRTDSSTTGSPTKESSTTDSISTEASTTDSSKTESPTTESSTTLSSTSEPSTTGSNTTESTTTDSTLTETSTTDSFTTESSTTNSSTTKSSVTEYSMTGSPTTKSSNTKSSKTESPTTDTFATESSTKEPSTTEYTTTKSSAKEPSTTDYFTIDSTTAESISTYSTSTESSSTQYFTDSSVSTESTKIESIESSTIVSSESTITSTNAVSITENTTEVDSTTPELLTDYSTTTDITTDVTTDLSASTTSPSETTETSNIAKSSVFTESSSTEVSTERSTTLESETTESTVTSSDLTTASDISTESTLDLTTETGVTEEGTTMDIWTSVSEGEGESSTKQSFTDILPTKKTGICKKKKCKTTKYGCCPDKTTIAKGPFDEGCPIPKTCNDTSFGCCPDGVSPASGKNNKGCPKSQCPETLFGCCPDEYTPAEGENNEGCPQLTTLPPTTTFTTEEEAEEITSTSESSETETTEQSIVKSCSSSEYGCCPDGKAEAQGANFAGCEDAVKDCHESAHGCCRDGRTMANGPNEAGCTACTQEPFGCCPDNQTPSHGPLGEGCCLNSPYGCCPDNINSAGGPNGEGCSCESSPFGCCPDKKTAAPGSNQEGCDCETSSYGCCPDKLTPASGANFEGCPCNTMQYGCCPDGLTFAKGPNHYGCACAQTDFKCCGDEKTPAKGPNQEGCTCAVSKYGCCPDGITSAQDEKFGGCTNVIEPIQTSCGLPKETGPCTNYTIKFFYDISYGSCTKFWYGGCDGNRNRFDSDSECKGTCQEYEGKERCLLPKNSGPCAGDFKKWYFDVTRGRCEEFTYGGCYGTTNRFDSLEECENICDIDDKIPPCEQPADSGPCQGTFERWYYDNETDICRPFHYGGCKGNKNNHATEHACNYNCRKPGIFKDQCLLPKQSGDCREQHPRWYYDESNQKCQPFYYTGCGGNKNSFPTLEFCETHCPKKVVKDICEIPAEVGECSDYTLMWYYDVQDKSCRQFYYGGCGGNEHKFATEAACLARCERKPETTTAQPKVVAPATSDSCMQPAMQGECEEFVIQWYYNSTYESCMQFYYGGCGGNSNRFPTQEGCDERCKQQPEPQPAPAPPPDSVQDNVCSVEADMGSCDNYVLKWTYNNAKQRCEQFYYGGCEGNGNRFETEDDCNRRCSTLPKVDLPVEESQPRDDETHRCFLSPHRGDCSESERRWYYYSGEGICYEFEYSGCGGNQNNFVSKDDCQNECDKVQPICSLPPVPGRCNETLVRWYYDARSQICAEFEFTGCDGNRNNFISERECISSCDTRKAAETPQQETIYSICELPAEAGDCDEGATAWFYDRESGACTAFTYSGCGGNGNRFETQEQCQRQCGAYKGVDACSEPVQSGPCRQWQTRFYFNSATRTCEAFTYGGCEGTANRFTDRTECESVCIVGQEPQTNNKDICKLPVEVGKCAEPNSQQRRWFYDDERGGCVAFIFSGCAGNQNNFRSLQACTRFCKSDDNEVSNEVLPTKCETYEEKCRELGCPFGVRRVPANDENDCSQCECVNPCENYECAEGQQCVIDISDDGNQKFEPVCRYMNKSGECPIMYDDNRNCNRECYNDANCRGDYKCCANACSFICVRPIAPTVSTARPTTAVPAVYYPGESKAALEPKQPHEVDVQSYLGGVAVLRCFATGIPSPNVTWSTNNLVIDTTQGRFLLTGGDLTIVQVRQTDSGSYVCVASNGLGEPVRRVVKLQVREPTNKTPAYIYGPKNVTYIGALSLPIGLRCSAGGNPEPRVTWWRNKKLMGRFGDDFVVTKDHALLFKSVKLTDLGVYTCQAYNVIGRAASLEVILMAHGPARALRPRDEPFLKYVLQPGSIETTQRPSYPYRPNRPQNIPPVEHYNPPQRTPLINAFAKLDFDSRNSNSLGSTVIINCAVEGSPTPNVTWTKDGVPLQADERIRLTENPYSVEINNLRAEDAGSYACHARNSHSHSTAEQTLNIAAAIYVPPYCEDDPNYVNCKLIVQGQYCNKNPYYARFCCKSCMLAGQLRLPLPALNGAYF